MSIVHPIKEIAKRIRSSIIESTTAAGSGHPSSSLSAVELTTVLFFGSSQNKGFFKQDVTDFQNPFNDKFILSKGHAAPLLYAIYEAAGVLSREELLTLRKLSSRLQGHPTPEVPFVDVTTGSLGQGLSVGVGMALGFAKKFKIQSLKFKVPRVYVLLGDSEFAEGQNYEALQIASHYKLNNLIAILDVNRLGQRGETQLGWDIESYKKRVEAFGWNTVVINDGHNIEEIQKAFSQLLTTNDQRPKMIIAKTIKGKGVSFMENADSWHGKSIPKSQLEQALKEIGKVNFSIHGVIAKPDILNLVKSVESVGAGLTGLTDLTDSTISTREAYGYALADLAKQNINVLALDAETSNSTYAEFVKKETPDQFIECFIAEQNMVSMALGLSKVGYIPFASSFAAFLSRAFDQIRMAQYSISPGLTTNHYPLTTLNIVGSHAGCSIGVDGASQMALEDIAMMRSIRNSTVLYPADGISTYKLTQRMASLPSVNYLRTTREKLPILYDKNEEFPIGGCKVHYCHPRERGKPVKNYNIDNHRLDPRLHGDDKQFQALIIAAGITLHEALKAQKILEEKNIHTVVIDLYSVKPLDSKTVADLAKKTNHIIVVEDHHEAGGIGEAVLSELSTNHSSLSTSHSFTHLCVRKEPRSGMPEELLKYEEIDAEAIVAAVM